MATDDSEVVGATFHRAAEWMRNNKSLKLSNEQKLNLYGLFKQVSVPFSRYAIFN